MEDTKIVFKLKGKTCEIVVDQTAAETLEQNDGNQEYVVYATDEGLKVRAQRKMLQGTPCPI